MDNGTKSLVNVLLSVLAPVLVLDHCSTEGPAFYELGTVWAMVIALALHFLLPVLDKEPAQQALEYNYAVSNMTWWGYLVIGVPLLATLFGVIKFLIRRLEAITALPSVTMR